MIHAKEIHRVELNVRSSGDRRNRVDAYFVTFECEPDADYQHRYEWCCRFEVPRGKAFKMKDYPSKQDALNQRGFTI